MSLVGADIMAWQVHPSWILVYWHFRWEKEKTARSLSLQGLDVAVRAGHFRIVRSTNCWKINKNLFFMSRTGLDRAAARVRPRARSQPCSAAIINLALTPLHDFGRRRVFHIFLYVHTNIKRKFPPPPPPPLYSLLQIWFRGCTFIVISDLWCVQLLLIARVCPRCIELNFGDHSKRPIKWKWLKERKDASCSRDELKKFHCGSWNEFGENCDRKRVEKHL